MRFTITFTIRISRAQYNTLRFAWLMLWILFYTKLAMSLNAASTVDSYGGITELIIEGSFAYTAPGVASAGLSSALPPTPGNYTLKQVSVRYTMRNQTCEDELQPAGCAGRVWVAADVAPLAGTPAYGSIVSAAGSTVQSAFVHSRYRVLGEERFNFVSTTVGSSPVAFDLQQQENEFTAVIPGNGLVFRPTERPSVYLWWRMGQPALVTWTARLVFQKLP